MVSDIFVAQSKPEDAVVGPLKTITYFTSDEDAAFNMLVNGMGLEASDWYTPSAHEKPDLDAYFGFASSENWKARRFFRSDDGENIQIRLIAVDGSKQSQVRPAVDGTYIGGLSIGFPMTNTDARDAHMQSLGFPSVVGVKRLEFSSPSGETYVSEEVHFTGPENIYVLGVKRPDIFVPVGPISEVAEIGAPAYSAICVEDCEATISFLADVLGFEIRRDMTLEVGDKSGLKLKKGSMERFVQAFAPGANTGYLVLLDHGEETKRVESLDQLGPPNRGLGMWSFPARDLAEVARRAKDAGVKVRHPVNDIASPFLPATQTLVLDDPNGVAIEIYQAK